MLFQLLATMGRDTSKDRDNGKKKGAKSEQRRASLQYPEHAFDPQDILTFLELRLFTKRWEQLGLDVEHDLLAAQVGIMINPTGVKVIEGTDGLRKFRFAPPRWNMGKSGAVRILHVNFAEYEWVLLCLAYGKNEVDTISAAVKKQLNAMIEQVKIELQERQTLRLLGSPSGKQV